MDVIVILEGSNFLMRKKRANTYSYQSFDFSSRMINLTEHFATTICLLRNATSYKHIFSIISHSCQFLLGDGLCVLAFDKFKELFPFLSELEPPDGEYMTFQSISDVRTKFGEFFSNYHTVKDSAILKQFRLFVMQVVGFFVQKETIDKSFVFTKLGITGANLPSPSTFDLVDCLLETVSHTLTILERCYNSNTLSPFLDSSIGEDDWEKNYADLVAFFPLLNTGNYAPSQATGMLDPPFNDEAHLIGVLEKTCAHFERATRAAISGPGKTLLQRKMTTLSKLRSEALDKLTAGNNRMAPFAVAICGPSGIGKSSVCTLAMETCLNAGGFSYTADHIVTLKEGDKFDSGMTAAKTGAIFDDLANTLPDKTQISPMTRVIDFINNIATPALSAAVEEKGRIPIRVKMVVATTNIKNLNAHAYSVEPVSICRRFRYFITPIVKPQFCRQRSHMLDPVKARGHDDLWDFTVEEVVARKNRKGKADSVGFERVTERKTISLDQLLKLLHTSAEEHYQAQEDYLRRADRTTVFCPHNSRASFCTDCIAASEQEEAPALGFQSKTSTFLTRLFAARMTYDVMNVSPPTRNLACWMAYERQWILPLGISVPFLYFILSSYLFAGITLCYLHTAFCLFIVDRVFVSSMTIKELLTKNGWSLLLWGLGLSSVVAMIRCYMMTRKTFQSGTEKIPEVYEGQRVNHYPRSVSLYPVEQDHCQRTADYFDMVTKSVSKVVRVRLCDETGATRETCMFPLKGTVWVLNRHAWSGEHMTFTGTFTAKEGGGSVKTCSVSKRETIQVGDTDLLLVCVKGFGPVATMYTYLPGSDITLPNMKLHSMVTNLCYRDAEMAEVTDVLRNVKYQSVKVQTYLGKAWTYETSETMTEAGMCGSPIIAKLGSVTFILGFHFAGNDGTRRGASLLLTRAAFETCYDKLMRQRHVCEVFSDGPLELQSYPAALGDKSVLPLSDEPHRLCASRNISVESSLCFRGQHSLGRRTMRSNVCKSFISDNVAKYMGFPREHGPPRLFTQPKRVYAAKMTTMSRQALINDKEMLFLAYDDFRKKIFDHLRSDKERAQSIIHPYSHVVAVSGAPGVTGVDSMDKQSSAGWPVNKAKHHFLVPADRTVYDCGDIEEPMVGDVEVFAEIARLENAYLRKTRAHPIFRANMKDEPTKFEKDKVRVFMGAPLAYNILFRMKFLSILKYMAEHRNVFECMVGVNATSREWSDVARFVTKFGDETLFAGDYKAFDDTQPADMTFRSLCILIDIAEWAGYNERDLLIMRGLATDAAYCTFEMDGNIFSVMGTLPSGFNATVQINGFNNSIYLRYAYYTIFKDKYDEGQIPPFHTRVSLATYGDDNIGSVHPEAAAFNHTSLAGVLATIGVTYTMADKKSASVPFLPISKVGFLKRQFVYSPEFDEFLAPLEEASIVKSLHCGKIKTPATREELAVDTLRGACREYFFHGEEVFETKRAQLEQVIGQSGLDDYFASVPLPTYDSLRHNFLGTVPIVEDSAAEVEL